MRWGKWAAVLGLAVNSAVAGTDTCGRGWVYFDLGNTIVDTSDWGHLKYVPLAHDYLLELKHAGFHLGLITNIPENWGTDQATKLATLKGEIAKTWSEEAAFGWEDFDEILLPPSDKERKPAPFLFDQALGHHVSCSLAYEGDDAGEVRAALLAGFKNGYRVGKDSPEGFFLPADHIFDSP